MRHSQLIGPGVIRSGSCHELSGLSILRGVVLALVVQSTACLAAVSTTESTLDANALFPAPGAVDVCPDTPLRLMFNAPPTVGHGKIAVIDASHNTVVQTVDVSIKTATQSIGGLADFNYEPLMISGNQATIDLPNHSLAYGKSYYLSMDAGAFTADKVASPSIDKAAGWRFKTKAAPPVTGTARLIVAADGTGDFCTVQGAVDWVPDETKARTTIDIRKGTYTQMVFVGKKHALTFTGEDRAKTVIVYANNAIFNPSSNGGYHRGVFFASGCNDLVINHLTIRNTTPRGGSQAEALILNGNPTSRAIVADVDLYSFQDTLQINGQAYVRDCYIEGDVDFMWGKGPCFFENCHCCGTRSRAFYTQVRNPVTNHGFVYHHCIFDGRDGVRDMYLSRIAPAAFPHSEVVLLDCILGPAVGPVGWLLNSSQRRKPAPTTAPEIRFWEFNSLDSKGNPIDVSKRLDISRQLKKPADAGLIDNYSNPGFVLGNDWQAQADPNLPREAGSK
jgi:pectin methylesterase-like acyl-CoA thioesterase